MDPGALSAGAVAGAGLFLLVFALIPRRVSLSRRLAAFDEQRSSVFLPEYADRIRERDGAVIRRLGRALAGFCAEQGWEFPSLRANLALADKSFESFLASKVLLGLSGILLGPVMLAVATAAGLRVAVVLPIWFGLALGALFFLLPDLEVKQRADQRRKDFRHAVGAFLDLVSMNLAGGRGVPEALMAASEMGDGWSMSRIRDALANARITGQTPWQALGGLADEVRVDELRDLASSLSLVANDGAKVRESLTARAATLRRRQLTDLEGQAGERSQSMLVAQMVLVMGFLVFLVYPVIPALIGV
jgi:tight adherence protein C